MGRMATLAIVRDHALEAVDRGWHVLACKPNGKDPFFPLAPKAYLSATNDRETVAAWWETHPSINYGVAASTSGLVVLDVDFRNLGFYGDKFLARLAETPTHTVATDDGFHFYFRATNLPARVPGKLRDGIDVKHKGYVVAAGSVHPSGAVYTTTDNREPVDCPAWVWGK